METHFPFLFTVYRKYDLQDVMLEQVLEVVMGGNRMEAPPEPCLRLYVPGLAEQRPSVLVGDSVCILNL